jgi:chromosome segregation ATPase
MTSEIQTSKSKIDEERVHELASSLIAKGIKPTVARIRELHGSGSYSTIGPFLKSWNEKHEDECLILAQHDPEAITKALRPLLLEMARQMQTFYDKEHETASQEIKGLIDKLQQSEDTYDQLITELEQKDASIQELIGANENSEEELNRGREAAQKLKEAMYELKEKLVMANGKVAELEAAGEKATNELNEIIGENEQLKIEKEKISGELNAVTFELQWTTYGQESELEIKKQLNKRVEQLEEENARLKQALNNKEEELNNAGGLKDVVVELRMQVGALQAELKVKNEFLERSQLYRD